MDYTHQLNNTLSHMILHVFSSVKKSIQDLFLLEKNTVDFMTNCIKGLLRDISDIMEITNDIANIEIITGKMHLPETFLY